MRKEKCEEERWVRLGKYADYRLRKFPLHRLPDDVLSCICSHLTFQEVQNLLHSMLGVEPSLFSKNFHLIPREIRLPWQTSALMERVIPYLLSLKEQVSFYAGHHKGSRIIAYVDWSPFSDPKSPPPIATYGWESIGGWRVGFPYRPARLGIKIHSESLRSLCVACAKEGRCACTILLYSAYTTGGKVRRASSRPIFAEPLVLFPYTLESVHPPRLEPPLPS